MFPLRDHNPSLRPAFVTWALIATNLALFFATMPWGGNMEELWFSLALYPGMVTHGQMLIGLVSHMFLHAGVAHIVGNMLFLWIFGDNLEEALGHFGFALLYFGAGLAAAAAQIVAEPASMVPMVGASGAIAGVMGGYLLLFPRARVDVLFIFIVFFKVIPVPAWLVLGVWFALQLFNGTSADLVGDGVAYWAHIGGFVTGLALTLPVWARRGATRFWARSGGHPDHPASTYPSRIPTVPRRRK
ncbi:rhomboid family intramembrane serine protease [Phaeovulum sp.]|uniref:rhomboid family intramembrane serine protease n=1 Tax=Phaeovulum sp. TaxID=2934796 RepID=UPI0035645D16